MRAYALFHSIALAGILACSAPVWGCVGGVPTGRILPAETRSARVSLGSTDSPQAQPPITPEQRVGRFRIEFALCTQHAGDSGDCEGLPQAERESNAFELRFTGP